MKFAYFTTHRGKNSPPQNVLDNRRTVEAASRLSYITGCSLFNHNPWSSWSKGIGCKLKGEKVMSYNLWWRWWRVANRMEPHWRWKVNNRLWLPVEIHCFFKSAGFVSSTFPIQPGFSQNQPAAITLYNTSSPRTLVLGDESVAARVLLNHETGATWPSCHNSWRPLWETSL
jgi:hypothetical protein